MPSKRAVVLAALLMVLGVVAAAGQPTAGDTRTGTAAAVTTPAESAFVVVASEIVDRKAVLATVRSKKVVDARVRTPGTVASLRVTEGAAVEPGQVLGVVADPKIALRMAASDAQIVALQSRLATAKAEFERTSELLSRGVAPRSRLDQAKTAFDVATNELAAARSERAVIERQAEEGQVLAPARGRILRVPVTEGSVVMPGEPIATIAADEYLLRLEVPERHARFMRVGETLRIGPRGLGSKGTAPTEGRIVLVYPEIQNGRVIADAEVAALGSYFVGERVLTWISAGARQGLLIPRDLVRTRFGLDYLRVGGAGGPIDVVVQLGQYETTSGGTRMVEVLAGVRPGDRLVMP